jgi:dihydropteroate synthase
MINKKNKEIVYEIDNYKAYKMGIVNMTPDSFYDN